jgi:hypothetical protein
MKEELEDFNRWLIENKNVNILPHVQEYLNNYYKPTITVMDIINYSAMLCIVRPEELLTPPKKPKSRVSNNICFARGIIVKYLLLLGKYDLRTNNIYKKIFGFPKDHSTAIHWRDMEFTLDDKRKYEALCKYLKNKEILWEK